MTTEEYIAAAPVDRQALLNMLHETIIADDSSITPIVKPMMGKDMILYEDHGYMKYGLADTKKYMSLHCLPMYMDKDLHAKYMALLPAAQFQKGCINFTDAEQMPIDTVSAFLTECALVNMKEVLENRKKKK